MNVRRGDVVLVDYPYPGGGGAKVRPALVVQNDRDNQRLLNTIVAQVTSVTRRALEPRRSCWSNFQRPKGSSRDCAKTRS